MDNGSGDTGAPCAGAKRVSLNIAALSAVLFALTARAQTLDQQYDFYLATTSERCGNLGFARLAFGELVPGQAGPNLFAYCSGPPLVGGGGGNGSSSGGGAGTGESRSEGAQEDAALRRRREHLRKANDDTPAAADAADFDLGRFGATSAFLSLDYAHERQKTTFYEAGRRSHDLAGTLGLDHRFGTQALAGLALKYDEQSGVIDSGGDFHIHGHGVWAYGSWTPRDAMFVDMAAGLGLRTLHTARTVSREIFNVDRFGNVTSFFNPAPELARSDTHEHDVDAELRTGYDFSFSSVSVGPRVALTIKHTSLDAYVESGNTPMTLAFDSQRTTSLRSLVGFQATRAFTAAGTVWVPQLNTDWVHEYRDDQRVITAHFAEDLRPNPAQLRFQNTAPDRDWLLLRASLVAVFAHGVSAFTALESTAAHSYIDRYRASVGMRVEL
ncbi:MAG: hypothetical protein JWN85_2509 [Gammaproteobacteria bacterium]|nr:hypothetical protein [Gammaproteobacteria bacterium]